jgi:hypothetical protein
MRSINSSIPDRGAAIADLYEESHDGILMGVRHGLHRADRVALDEAADDLRGAVDRQAGSSITPCSYNVPTIKQKNPLCSNIVATTSLDRELGMRKDAILRLRVSNQEKAAFEEAAKLRGLNMSTWARERLRWVATQELERADRPVPFVGAG